MNHEIARAQVHPRIESLPFSKLPHQTRLFLDHIDDSVSLRKYYPNAVASVDDLREFVSDVLTNYATDRDVLCDALTELNRDINAGEKTFENIELLRRDDTVAVVTGQQAGLFTGPLYTIYKALSAIKAAEVLSASGTRAVPVFWVASEDHDLDEVSKAFFLSENGELVSAGYKPNTYVEDAPVGDIKIDATIDEKLDELVKELGGSAWSADMATALRDAWKPGVSFATAFAKSLAAILSNFGLILVDPLDKRLKQLVSPLYVSAIQMSAEIIAGIRERSAELERSGYHAQVLAEKDYFPLFWHTDDGRRVALRKTGDVYRSKGEGREFNLDELAEIAKAEPSRFSPGVMLRPVAQDFLLPTVCYFGGAAEIAYFAQNSEAYRALGRPITPILHRQSFTVVEPKQARTFEKLGIDLTDLFDGIEGLTQKAVEQLVSPETAKLFANVEETINIELNRLDQALSDLDPTLAANLATRRRKIIYHIAALKKKAYRAQLQKASTVDRQIKSAFSALLPNGELQERVINVHSYLNKYGRHFIDWLYESIDLEDRAHHIVYI